MMARKKSRCSNDRDFRLRGRRFWRDENDGDSVLMTESWQVCNASSVYESPEGSCEIRNSRYEIRDTKCEIRDTASLANHVHAHYDVPKTKYGGCCGSSGVVSGHSIVFTFRFITDE